jgi:hypothetical protein
MGFSADTLDENRIVLLLVDSRRLKQMYTDVIKELTSQKCLFFDDISTMLLHSLSVTISKFIQFTTNKLRLFDVTWVFLAFEKGLDPALLTQISTFMDKVETVKEEGK